MNKTTEALKLAEEALNAMLTHMGMDEDEWTKPTFNQAREALAAILEALAEPVCEHRIADARNEFVRDGYICIKCGALFRAAFHAEPVKQEPVAVISESAIGLVKLHSNGACLPFGTQLYAAPVEPVKQEPVAWENSK